MIKVLDMLAITAKQSLLKRQAALLLRLENVEFDLHRAYNWDGSAALEPQVSDELEQKNTNLAVIASKTAHQLMQIEQVLDKLGRDSYGCCVDCGKPIGAERLKALPQSSTCLGCTLGH